MIKQLDILLDAIASIMCWAGVVYFLWNHMWLEVGVFIIAAKVYEPSNWSE